MGKTRIENAFTLIEVAAVAAVLAILTAITVPAFSMYMQEGRKALEISAGRKIIAGYLLYAADNDGALMPGYAPSGTQAVDASGSSIHFPANARYPWRLAPYLDYDMRAILFNGNERALVDKVDFHYAASVSPNLGMNVVYVGGHYGSGSPLVPNESSTSRYGNFCVTRLDQASKPAKLIVFASARRSKTEVGYFEITPPNFTGISWGGKWNPEAPAAAYGYIDMRYGRKAVAAMLDGHIQMLDEDEIQDMRRWSNQAAEQDNPRFTIKRIDR